MIMGFKWDHAHTILSQCLAHEHSANNNFTIDSEEIQPSHWVRYVSFLQFAKNRELYKLSQLIGIYFFKRYKGRRKSMKKIWAATQLALRIRTSHTCWEEDNNGRTTVLEARDASQTGCWLPHPEDSATRCLSISLFCCFWLFSAPPGFFLLNGFR